MNQLIDETFVHKVVAEAAIKEVETQMDLAWNSKTVRDYTVRLGMFVDEDMSRPWRRIAAFNLAQGIVADMDAEVFFDATLTEQQLEYAQKWNTWAFVPITKGE